MHEFSLAGEDLGAGKLLDSGGSAPLSEAES